MLIASKRLCYHEGVSIGEKPWPTSPLFPSHLKAHLFSTSFFASIGSHGGACAEGERLRIASAAAVALQRLERRGTGAPVQSALFSQLGHKGDLVLIHFRDSLEALNQVELDLAQTGLYDFLTLSHSYVSVVELGLYKSSRKSYEAAAAKAAELAGVEG